MEQRDHREDERRYLEQKQHEEILRRTREPDKMVHELVHESIYKAFLKDDRPRETSTKSHVPPPAHSGKPLEKSSANTGYSVSYQAKEAKTSHPSERLPYPLHHDKPSVIVQPDIKYEKTTVHSMSPKPRQSDRTSPYSSNSGSYKVYETSQSPHRVSSHHPASLNPSNVDLVKIRQPQSSPHSTQSQTHNDRYYHTSSKPITTNAYTTALINQGLVPNPLHVVTVSNKPKVSSPPPQMYGKPGITSGTPVCRADIRPSQSSPITNKPPPAHSSSRDSRVPLPVHESRTTIERIPFDARVYPPNVPSPHHKQPIIPSVPTQLVKAPTVSSSPHIPSHHVPSQSSPQPTQTQPLDLGTREDAASPTKRQSHTPTPQDSKKPRLDTNSTPLLSRVSEPSPLYPSAATTITTVENTVAIANLQQAASPVNSRPSSQPQPSVTPTPQGTEPSKLSEPEKSVSPGPAAGYVHKLKKAWLQRHESGAEIPLGSNSSSGDSNSCTNSNSPPPTTNFTSRVATPPPLTNSLSKITTNSINSKNDKNLVRKSKSTLSNIPNGHSQDIKDQESTTTDSESSITQKSKRSKGKRSLKRIKKSSDSNSDSESDGSETCGKKLSRPSSKQDVEPKKRGRKPKSKIDKDKDDTPKVKKMKEESPQNDPLMKPSIAHLKKTGENFLQDGPCYEVAPRLPKCRECRWTANQRNKKMPNIFCRFHAFRCLRFTKSNQLAVAGFSDPDKDAYGDDLSLWVPDIEDPAPDLDVEMSKFLLTHVGDQFCDLVRQEKEAMALHMGEG